jgi:hypothetical protein
MALSHSLANHLAHSAGLAQGVWLSPYIMLDGPFIRAIHI